MNTRKILALMAASLLIAGGAGAQETTDDGAQNPPADRPGARGPITDEQREARRERFEGLSDEERAAARENSTRNRGGRGPGDSQARDQFPGGGETQGGFPGGGETQGQFPRGARSGARGQSGGQPSRGAGGHGGMSRNQ